MHFDWNSLFHVEWTVTFGLALLNIMFINLILSGDNAVLIAMAVRNLPESQRRKGILFGTGAAIVLRVILTYFVCLLLEISFIKLVGGLLIFWIAIKLLMEGDGEEGLGREAATLWQAIRIILIADLTMSLDNVLAVAGAAEGNLFLLVFGLVISIPIVIFTSEILSKLMDRYPIIIVVGGAILGKVAGEMIMGDQIVAQWFQPTKVAAYAVQLGCVAGVVVTAKLWLRWKVSRVESDR